MNNFRLALFTLALFRFAHEHLLAYLDDLICSVAVEKDDVVDVRAVRYELILLQTCADETFGAVDVELLVCLCHFCRLDSVEVAYLGESRMLSSVLLLKETEPLGCHLHEVCQVALDFFYLRFCACYEFVGLVLVELKDASHLDFHESEDVVLSHFAHELRIERSESFIDVFAGSIHRLGVFELASLIYAFFDENLFERSEVERFKQFVAANFQFLADEVFGVVDRQAQHVAHSEELRHLVVDDAAVRRDAYFAVCEGVERVDCLVGRYARGELHDDFHLVRGVVVYLLSLYLAFLNGFQY